MLVVHDVRRLAVDDAPLFERIFYRFVVPRGIRRADTIVTVSEFSRAEIERVTGTPGDRISVAGHSVRRRSSTPAVRSTGPLVVVGAVREYKGVDTVLEALARLEEPERPHLVLAGTIEDPRVEEHVRSLGLEPWVTMEGWVPQERLDSLYDSALATVCPSRYEGYGLALAASISRGLPTVASDIPSHREIAGDAALFFPAGDVDALADSLRQVGHAETRRRLAGLAFERAGELEARGAGAWSELVRAATGSTARPASVSQRRASPNGR